MISRSFNLTLYDQVFSNELAMAKNVLSVDSGLGQTSLFSCAEPNSCIKFDTRATFDLKFDR